MAPLSRAELAADPRAFTLALERLALRRRWPLSRKLALFLGGRRVREALARSYRPALRLETRGSTGEPLGVWLTAFDLEICRELGRRHLELLGLGPRSARVLSLTGRGTDVASWQVREALLAAAVPAAFTPPPRGGAAAGAALRAAAELRPTALLGRPADLVRLARAARDAGQSLAEVELSVLLLEPAGAALRGRVARELEAAGARSPRLAAAYGLAEVRTLYVECPSAPDAPSGVHLYPDAVLAEVEPPEEGGEGGRGEHGEPGGAPGPPAGGGELLLTPLLGHGTAVFRYRTGDRVAGPVRWGRCPACGRGLPRLEPGIARLGGAFELGGRAAWGAGAGLDLAALAAALDARAELLEWQAVRLPGEGGGPRLGLRVAAAPGTAAERLARELSGEAERAGAPSPPEVTLHSEREMLDFLAAPHEMAERRFLDLQPPPPPPQPEPR